MPRLAGLSGPPSSVVVSSPLKRHRAQGNPARVNRPNRPMVDRWSLQNFRAEPGRATLNERQLSALGQKAGNEHVPAVTDAPRPLEWHKPYREVAGFLAVAASTKDCKSQGASGPGQPCATGRYLPTYQRSSSQFSLLLWHGSHSTRSEFFSLSPLSLCSLLLLSGSQLFCPSSLFLPFSHLL